MREVVALVLGVLGVAWMRLMCHPHLSPFMVGWPLQFAGCGH